MGDGVGVYVGDGVGVGIGVGVAVAVMLGAAVTAPGECSRLVVVVHATNPITTITKTVMRTFLWINGVTTGIDE